MSAIFDNANQIQLDYIQNIPMHLSQSGFRTAEVRSPFLYKFVVTMNDMSTDSPEYRSVNKEIRGVGSGLKVMLTNIPPNITKARGSWSTKAGENIRTERIINQGFGKTVYLQGFSLSKANVMLDGDYIQFSSSNKVYQVVGDYDSNNRGLAFKTGNNRIGVELNTPLVADLNLGSVITFGSNVIFSLQLEEFSLPRLVPQNVGSDIASWSEFTFTEVINRLYIDENNVAQNNAYNAVSRQQI